MSVPMANNPAPRYLTIGEVATRLGRSVDTIRNYHASEVLIPAFIGPGKRRYYDPADVAQLEADMRAAVKNGNAS